MKLLVFEYITGGGYAERALPESLLREGKLMLQALLDELAHLPELEIRLLLDQRCGDLMLPGNVHTTGVPHAGDMQQILRDTLTECDALWPIAPETDGILAGLAELATACGKLLLLSSPETVVVCADKWTTYQRLRANDIPAVTTLILSGLQAPPFVECVIKPIDGVGCEGSHITTGASDFRRIADSLSASGRYIVQPLVVGRAVSLSCLYKNGQAWLLSYNEQLVDSESGQFSLRGCRINVSNPDPLGYTRLINKIAQTLPDLWGYVGIDLIETATGPQVLEINPRLTTSYAGIGPAIGINVAEQVLRLLQGEPALIFSGSRSIEIVIQ